MPIKLNTSSGGGVVLTGANTASDKTITVPAVDGTMIYADSSGNMQFNSGYGSVATAYGCRAWVNFQGSGTVTIRASGNVSSITDNTTGDYTVNFTTAMPDVNYLVSCAGRNTAAGTNINPLSEVSSASALRVVTFNTSWVSADPQYVYVAIFR